MNVPFSFCFSLYSQNEGKWFVSQNNFKSISGSVEQHAVSDDEDDDDEDDASKGGVGGGLR